jgi:predicted kinase
VGREESVNASAGYLRWVEQNAQRARPSVVLMVGLTGSGKTWLARQLVPRLDAFHVRSDVERKRLAGLGPLESSSSPPDAGIYSRDFNEKTYARLLDCARHCVNGHESVIIDAASLRRRERRAFASLAQASGARFRMVHCVAPLEELRVRVAQRHRDGLDASEATEELLARQPGYREPFDESELAAVIDADTTSPSCLALVCEALGPVTRS